MYMTKFGMRPTGEENTYLFWRISLVDNVHHIVSDMTDEQPYKWIVITVESCEF